MLLYKKILYIIENHNKIYKKLQFLLKIDIIFYTIKFNKKLQISRKNIELSNLKKKLICKSYIRKFLKAVEIQYLKYLEALIFFKTNFNRLGICIHSSSKSY